MKRCAIITGGKYQEIKDIGKCDFIIACDKGYEYCLKDSIIPDLLIGDFDSYTGKLPEDIETEILPEEKDDTDTMHAYRYCVNHNYDEIYLYCCFGSRMDHFIATIQAAIYGAHNGISTYMSDDNNMFIITDKNEIVLDRIEGYSLSLFAADKLSKVTIEGARYNIKDFNIYNYYPIGQSNEWKDDTIRIYKEEGVMIIICSRID
ncbi:MAG: thiamine diphosphokinase [Erysipelotrichaceae bacterium]|nr:thiamine diphosphokinase [Erysipelotrichaceae bacterium]